MAVTQVIPEDLDVLKTLLAEIQGGVASVKESVSSWRERQVDTFTSLGQLTKTSTKYSLSTSQELSYPSGISLLSLKNHLLLSYLHHLVALFALRLSPDPAVASLTSPHGTQLVTSLVRLRVVLEKVSPLEGKLKYQIEKLVRKADLAAEGGDDEDVVNDPLAFRPNPANLVLDRTGSEDEDDDGEGGEGRADIYRPPRIAAMPYAEGPAKRGKEKKALPSHLISDISAGLSSSTPYGESTSGLSVTVDPSLSSGTARHLRQVEDYELSNFTRMRMSKKDSKKRRAEEEEVAFGGLGAGKGGKRRLGGFGAEFDDLLGDMGGQRASGAYEEMKGFKRPKVGKAPTNMPDEGAGTSGLAGLAGQGARKGKKSSNTFDRAVGRSKYAGWTALDVAHVAILFEMSSATASPSTARRGVPGSVPRASLAVRSSESPAQARVAHPAWRASLSSGDYQTRMPLSEREKTVRTLAEEAWNRLAEVGDDGDEGGAIRLDDARRNVYRAFEAAKIAFLSPSRFLSADELPSAFTGVLKDPHSDLSTLIRLSNLTTFLYVILAAGPDPTTGQRPQGARERLNEAVSAFLRFIVPPEAPLHEGVLKMLISLKRQAYLAAAADAASPSSNADHMFSTPFASHTSASASASAPRSSGLSPQQAHLRFATLSNETVKTIHNTGEDLPALEAAWKWSDCENELRQYVKQVKQALTDGPDGLETGHRRRVSFGDGEASFDILPNLADSKSSSIRPPRQSGSLLPPFSYDRGDPQSAGSPHSENPSNHSQDSGDEDEQEADAVVDQDYDVANTSQVHVLNQLLLEPDSEMDESSVEDEEDDTAPAPVLSATAAASRSIAVLTSESPPPSNQSSSRLRQAVSRTPSPDQAANAVASSSKVTLEMLSSPHLAHRSSYSPQNPYHRPSPAQASSHRSHSEDPMSRMDWGAHEFGGGGEDDSAGETEEDAFVAPTRKASTKKRQRDWHEEPDSRSSSPPRRVQSSPPRSRRRTAAPASAPAAGKSGRRSSSVTKGRSGRVQPWNPRRSKARSTSSHERQRHKHRRQSAPDASRRSRRPWSPSDESSDEDDLRSKMSFKSRYSFEMLPSQSQPRQSSEAREAAVARDKIVRRKLEEERARMQSEAKRAAIKRDKKFREKLKEQRKRHGKKTGRRVVDESDEEEEERDELEGDDWEEDPSSEDEATVRKAKKRRRRTT